LRITRGVGVDGVTEWSGHKIKSAIAISAKTIKTIIQKMSDDI
jgi:hypothetical protein